MKTLKITLAVLLILGLAGYLFQVFSTRSLAMEKAPVRATGTIMINASPEEVFNRLADINHWNHWLPNVTRAKLNGPMAPESTFDWTVNGMEIHSTLQKVDPYSSLEWQGNVYGIYALHNWHFKEKNGGTEVSVAESMQGLFASLLKGYFNKTLLEDMGASLVQLKSACEKEAAH